MQATASCLGNWAFCLRCQIKCNTQIAFGPALSALFNIHISPKDCSWTSTQICSSFVQSFGTGRQRYACGLNYERLLSLVWQQSRFLPKYLGAEFAHVETSPSPEGDGSHLWFLRNIQRFLFNHAVLYCCICIVLGLLTHLLLPLV